MDAFKLWCWRRLLSPLDCKEIQLFHPKGDQSWVFILSVHQKDLRFIGSQRVGHDWATELNWTDLMLKLKLQYFGHLMRRADSLEKTLMLGGIGGRRRRGQLRMRWLVWVSSGSRWWTGRPGVLPFMGLQRVGHDWATELNWTSITVSEESPSFCTLIHSCFGKFVWIQLSVCYHFYYIWRTLFSLSCSTRLLVTTPIHICLKKVFCLHFWFSANVTFQVNKDVFLYLPAPWRCNSIVPWLS